MEKIVIAITMLQTFLLILQSTLWLTNKNNNQQI